MRLTTTDIERKKCFEYLTDKGLHPIAPDYVYTEKDGVVTACCGILLVGMLEPFASDNKIDGLLLFGFAQGIVRNFSKFTVAFTDKEEVKSILNQMDFNKWSKDYSDIYIKET